VGFRISLFNLANELVYLFKLRFLQSIILVYVCVLIEHVSLHFFHFHLHLLQLLIQIIDLLILLIDHTGLVLYNGDGFH
jgi:hypothetical protein